MRIETERLILRKLQYEDTESVYKNWASDPKVTKYLTWPPHKDVSVTASIMEMWQKEYLQDKCYRFGIERKEDHELIGMIDVVGYVDDAPMIGYVLGRAFWNRGYMSEACKAVIDFLWKQGFERIVIEAIDENIGSNRVIEKCGFTYTGTKRRPISKMKPVEVNIHSYELIREA